MIFDKFNSLKKVIIIGSVVLIAVIGVVSFAFTSAADKKGAPSSIEKYPSAGANNPVATVTDPDAFEGHDLVWAGGVERRATRGDDLDHRGAAPPDPRHHVGRHRLDVLTGGDQDVAILEDPLHAFGDGLEGLRLRAIATRRGRGVDIGIGPVAQRGRKLRQAAGRRIRHAAGELPRSRRQRVVHDEARRAQPRRKR